MKPISLILSTIKKYNLVPISVQQRVLAMHPKTLELRTAKILTASDSEFRAQFDRPELGAPLIDDYNLVPINN